VNKTPEQIMDAIDEQLVTLDETNLFFIYNMICSPSVKFNPKTNTYDEIT
jgi:hypothetical protein